MYEFKLENTVEKMWKHTKRDQGQGTVRVTVVECYTNDVPQTDFLGSTPLCGPLPRWGSAKVTWFGHQRTWHNRCLIGTCTWGLALLEPLDHHAVKRLKMQDSMERGTALSPEKTSKKLLCQHIESWDIKKKKLVLFSHHLASSLWPARGN